jgi:hypothetical protein
MESQRAEISIFEEPDGARVEIEYADGHTVRMSVASDSIVLKMHLGLPIQEEERK